jgi:hypothetical protein
MWYKGIIAILGAVLDIPLLWLVNGVLAEAFNISLTVCTDH